MLVALSVLILVVTVCAYRYNTHSLPSEARLEQSSAERNGHAPTEDDHAESTARRKETSEKNTPVMMNGSVMKTTASPPRDDDASPQTTPKATAIVKSDLFVPSFTLSSDDAKHADSDDEDEDDSMPPPSFPALNSVQRASAAPARSSPPKLKPLSNGTPNGDSRLMPPPPRLPNLRGGATQPANSLRIPSTGPLPNRGPSSNSLMPPPYKTTNARNKIILKPGHSPLDWAQLQRSSNNLSGVSSLQRVTPSQLKQNNGRKGKPAWASYQGRVYNMTPYVPFHPGGEGEIRRAAGKDGEKLFMEVHPWVNWENMLGECLVGIMVSEAEESGGSLDDMD